MAGEEGGWEEVERGCEGEHVCCPGKVKDRRGVHVFSDLNRYMETKRYSLGCGWDAKDHDEQAAGHRLPLRGHQLTTQVSRMVPASFFRQQSIL